MARQPAIKAQEHPILPPKDSVPVTGRKRPFDRCAADGVLQSPVPLTGASVREGEKLFRVHCALCHGAKGDGKGPMASKFIPPPDITSDYYKATTDGYLYGVIRSGGHVMPSYAEALEFRQRWHIVNYIRDLQGAGPVPLRLRPGGAVPGPCPELKVPPGRGGPLLLGYCSGCHAVSLVTESREDRAGWDEVIELMVEEEGAPRPSDDHRAVLLEYLATHFGRSGKGASGPRP